jgi:hypothetical protein
VQALHLAHTSFYTRTGDFGVAKQCSAKL